MDTVRVDRRTFLGTASGAIVGLAAGRALAAEAAGAAVAGPGVRALFNGKDLTGWKAEGNAKWTVEDGCLVGVQGPNAAPGDLFTEEEFADFEVQVTYKVHWPANSGVWFRYQSPEKAYQADILEFKDPVAYSGTLYCPGRLFLAVNKDPKLEKKDDWNTVVITAQGDHLKIVLNGATTADVHDGAYAKGRIGFQIHPGDEFKTMKLTVREVLLRPLGQA